MTDAISRVRAAHARVLLANAYRDNGDLGASHHVLSGFDLTPDTQIALLAIRDALAETAATPVEAGADVAEGWRLVPVEPTEDLLKAGCAIPGVSLETGRRMWSQMLAAAPTPPVTK